MTSLFTTVASASASWTGVLSHAAVDLLLLGVLVGVAYRRRQGDTDTAFVLGALNVGLFVTLVAVSGDAFTTGAGFGLFGMLSLIRLRSASFTTVDMAYAFVALVIGLVMGLVGLPLALAAGLAGTVVAAVLVGERLRSGVQTVRLTVVLDAAHAGVDEARADAQARLRMTVLDLTVVDVDFVKETTTVAVVCAVVERARPLAPAALGVREVGASTILPQRISA